MTVASPLAMADFSRFGDVIRIAGPPDRLINAGRCERFHDLARIDCAEGRVGLSLFRSEPVAMPAEIAMLERHPLGSQAFLPLSPEPFLVAVAEDRGGVPGPVHAFLTEPFMGVNYLRGVWHAVLMPLLRRQDFAVIDYVGPEPNLEEHVLPAPVRVDPGR